MIQKIIEDWIEKNHIPTINVEGYLMVSKEDLTKLLVKYKTEQLIIDGVVFNEANTNMESILDEPQPLYKDYDTEVKSEVELPDDLKKDIEELKKRGLGDPLPNNW